MHLTLGEYHKRKPSSEQQGLQSTMIYWGAVCLCAPMLAANVKVDAAKPIANVNATNRLEYYEGECSRNIKD